MGLDCEHGLSLETGIYICKISPGSAAAKEGNLAVGDRVLSVSLFFCIFFLKVLPIFSLCMLHV